MARKVITVTAPTTTPTTPTTTTTTNGNPAVVAAPTASSASIANLVNWLTSPANVAAGGRKGPPPAHTVAGMLLALLATGPASLAMCSAAVANADSTGKAHNLAPLVQRMVRLWGYSIAYQGGNLVLVARPANG